MSRLNRIILFIKSYIGNGYNYGISSGGSGRKGMEEERINDEL